VKDVQVAVAVVAGAAAYLQRQNSSSDSYQSSGLLAAPMAAAADAFHWIKSKIPGPPLPPLQFIHVFSSQLEEKCYDCFW
jgi:hypothetical protein